MRFPGTELRGTALPSEVSVPTRGSLAGVHTLHSKGSVQGSGLAVRVKEQHITTKGT